MKRLYFTIIGISIIRFCFSQEASLRTGNVLRFNILNPGIEYGSLIFKKSTISANIGFNVKKL